MADLSQHDWQKGINENADAVVLDVRTFAEVSRGVIPGSMHIDIYKAPEFLDRIQSLDKDKSYYVYCRVGGRSGQACNIMRQLGFKYTYNLLGGIEQWQGPLTTLNNNER